MEDRLSLVPGAEVLDPEHVHQKVREFPHTVAQDLRALAVVGQILEDERVVVRDHRRTRAGGTHDVVEALLLEDIKEAAGNGASLAEKAGVEGRLATTGLPLGVDDLRPEPPEDAHHADANLGVYQVHITRDEQSHPHETNPPFPPAPSLTQAHPKLDAVSV
jgi:hypothetical protein